MAGLVFWASSEKRLYQFAIVPADRTYAVIQEDNGRVSYPIPWTANPIINKDAEKSNSLRIVTQNNTATLYINGVFMQTLSGAPPADGQFVGTAAGCGSPQDECIFDNFQTKPVTAENQPKPVAPAPTSPGSNTSNILFQDDFSLPNPVWGIANDQWTIEKGKLTIKLPANKQLAILNQTNLFGSSDIRLQANNALGIAFKGTFGPIFWAKSPHDFYALLITQGSGFAVGHSVNGQWVFPVTWKQNDFLLNNPTGPLSLRISTGNSQATIYIDDKQAAQFQGTPPVGGQFIGFYATATKDQPGIFEFTMETLRDCLLTTKLDPTDTKDERQDALDALPFSFGPLGAFHLAQTPSYTYSLTLTNAPSDTVNEAKYCDIVIMYNQMRVVPTAKQWVARLKQFPGPEGYSFSLPDEFVANSRQIIHSEANGTEPTSKTPLLLVAWLLPGTNPPLQFFVHSSQSDWNTIKASVEAIRDGIRLK